MCHKDLSSPLEKEVGSGKRPEWSVRESEVRAGIAFGGEEGE